jgi:hypothetical protein
MGITSAQARKKRGQQPGKSDQRITAKRTKQKIEPHYIRLQLPKRSEDSECARRIVKRPASQHGKSIQFGLLWRNLVTQDREAEQRIAAQFLCNVKPILAQPALAGRKCGHQTNLHDSEGLMVVPLR